MTADRGEMSPAERAQLDAASHDWLTDVTMPDDETQTLADVLAVMRENNLQRQAAFVEWIAGEWYDLSAELQWRDHQGDPEAAA